MRGLGTDVLAVACIVGGAAVGGGATLAALRDGAPQRCETQTIAIPRVAVRVGGGRDVVVRPRVVRVEHGHGCATVVVGEDVNVRLDEARARVEVARMRVERAREQVDAVRVRADEARQRADEMRARADAMRQVIEETRLQAEVPTDEIRAKVQQELSRIEKELARLDGGGDGR